METNLNVQALRVAFKKLLTIAPRQSEFVHFAEDQLELELSNGGRKSRITKMLKEFNTYAKNVLDKDSYALFKLGDLADVDSDGRCFLASVCEKGEITSNSEYSRTMDEINSFLQQAHDLSNEDENLIRNVNQCLAKYDIKMKKMNN